jgi:hypothetical protein
MNKNIGKLGEYFSTVILIILANDYGIPLQKTFLFFIHTRWLQDAGGAAISAALYYLFIRLVHILIFNILEIGPDDWKRSLIYLEVKKPNSSSVDRELLVDLTSYDYKKTEQVEIKLRTRFEIFGKMSYRIVRLFEVRLELRFNPNEITIFDNNIEDDEIKQTNISENEQELQLDICKYDYLRQAFWEEYNLSITFSNVRSSVYFLHIDFVSGIHWVHRMRLDRVCGFLFRVSDECSQFKIVTKGL